VAVPPGWSGETARMLFDDLNRALGAPAREHATNIIHGER
jgi:phenylacetic acid degradation operon negative regulatory protein